MGNLVAVQGMTLTIVNSLPTPVLGIITILGVPSVTNKAEGKGAYLDNLQIQIANITSPAGGATIPDLVPKIVGIPASIQKAKEFGVYFLVVNDITGIINATPQIPGSPPSNYPVTFQVQITNANQTVWKVE